MPDCSLILRRLRSCRSWRPRTVALTLIALTAILGTSASADVDDEYNLALQFYKQSRWKLAEEKLQQFLKEAPRGHAKVPLAKLYLGQALVHQRNFQDARPVFRDFVMNHSRQEDIPLAMYRVAECSYFLDDFASAERELTAFLRKVPPDYALAEWALQYLGETELKLEKHAQAQQAFAKGLEQFENGRLNEEMRFGLARAYEGLDRDADARTIYEQLASASGRRAADARFNLAAQLFEAKQYRQSAEEFAAVTKDFAQHNIVPLATLNAGYSHYHLGEYSQAMDLFSKVRGDEELGPTAEYWIGLSLKSQGDFDEASKVLLDQLKKDDQQPLAESLLFHAADSRLGAKDYVEARRLFEEVHRRWSTGELADDSLHLATEAAILAGDVEDAEKLSRQFKAEFPQSGLKLPQQLLEGRLLLSEGDRLEQEEGPDSRAAKQRFRDAAEAFTRVLNQSTIEETQSLARLQLARAWDRLANYEQALSTLKPLVDAGNQESPADDALTAIAMQSAALLSLKRYDESIAAAKQYLSHQPQGTEAADAWANVAVAGAHKQDWPAATEAIAKVRDLGDQTLADRVAYEAAEAAYDYAQWDVARTLYEGTVKRGSDGEFYRPALSGLAYSLYEQGRVLDEQVKAAEERGESATTQLAAAIGKFDDAVRWFTQLAELSGAEGDTVVQSDALYMKGLSLRLARRLPSATDVFLEVTRSFALPDDADNASETAIKTGYNAFRSAKEAARAQQDIQPLDDAQRQQLITAADAAYEVAHEQLQRQPADRHDTLDDLINEWALMHYNHARTLESDGNAEQANAAYERANELFAKLAADYSDSPWADDARLLLAEHLYFVRSNYDSARAALEELLADETTDDFVRQRSLMFLMDIAGRLEDWPQLAETAKTLAESYPNGPHRWESEFRQGEAALQQEDFETAQRILSGLADRHDDDALANQQWYPGVWLMLAETALRQKGYDKVRETAKDFALLFPESPFQYHLDDVVGRSLKQQAHFDEARAAFARVIDSPHGKGTETAAKAQLFIAETYFVQKKYEPAFEEYYRVLLYGFPEWQSAALFQAGKCEELLKRWQGAAKSYRQLLEEHPGSDYADDARQRLGDLEQRFPETVGS